METQCPKCGGVSGYYDRTIQSHEQQYRFDGVPDNCEVQYIRGGTRKYCSDCDADITGFVISLKEVPGDE